MKHELAVLAAWLHDIGKFAQRAGAPASQGLEQDLCPQGQTHRHVLYTDYFIEHVLPLPPEMESVRGRLARMAAAHHQPDSASREEVAGHIAAMRAVFSAQRLSCHVQHAHDSLIVRTTLPSGPSDVHSAIELFADESMKLTVPAVLLDAEKRAEAVACMRELDVFSAAEGRLIDARATLRRVSRMAAMLDRYVRRRRISWQQYAVAYELENMAGIILWSDEPIYRDYIRERGVLSCGTTDCRSRVRYLDDGAHNSFRARQFAGSHFFEACGLPLGSPDPQDNALVDALLSTSGVTKGS